MKKRASLCLLLSLLLLTTGCNSFFGKEDETMTETTEPRPAYSDAAVAATADDGKFEIAYETESYVKIGESIILSSAFVTSSASLPVVYETLTPELCTSDWHGKVTGVAAGLGYVRAFVNDDLYFDFPVTILPDDISDEMMLAVKANNSNVFVRENLGIGAGTPSYYRDIYGSVSKVQYNDPLVIDRQFENLSQTIHYGKRSSYGYKLEYITVHYTGNMATSATARNNADWFSWTTQASIHYVTGNDGVFSVLNDDYIAVHAGDFNNGSLTWRSTGVMVDYSTDYTRPTFAVSENKKIMINGQETSRTIPTRGGYPVYDGTNYMTLKDGERYLAITELGLPWKIVNGEYYLGTVWWCYRQKSIGCLCGCGGDANSLSIESAVNPETDLWYTWHKTAQLTAKLLIDNNLDTTRVTGHNMWTSKNCPQPMLENDLEIWYEFRDMVDCEYEMIERVNSGAVYSMRLIEGTDVCTDTAKAAKLKHNGEYFTYTLYPGRVVPNDETQVVVYEVTVETANGTESIKLCSAVNHK